MTIRLRPHHLLCILTFVGKGYSPAFTANMRGIAGQIAAGTGIEIVDGPDDICAPLSFDPDAHCHRPGVIERDRNAAREVGTHLHRTIRAGDRLVLDRNVIARLRMAFSSNGLRSACASYEWADLCTEIADSGYDAAILPAVSRTECPTTS